MHIIDQCGHQCLQRQAREGFAIITFLTCVEELLGILMSLSQKVDHEERCHKGFQAALMEVQSIP